jgi:NarL family two-component system sensor histidine kinase YdfH
MKQARYNDGKMKSPIVQSAKPDRDYRIFYLLMTLVIAAVYVSTIMTEPSLQEPWRLVVLTILVIIHIILHWFLEVIAERGWTLAYVITQGVLALAIVLMANTNQMLFGLYTPLMGEVAGLLGLNRYTLLAILYYLALSIVNFINVTGAGAVGWWALVIIPSAFFTILYTTMYVRQAQARERAQMLLAELEAANRQLSEYAARVEDLTIASERQRMARELHDTLSQGLAGLILQLEAVDAHLTSKRTERARGIVRETMEQARFTLADARRAIDDLRSTETLGLREAASQEATRFTAATSIPCEVDISLPTTLPEAVTETAIRAITESLNNIARHARAKNAKLRIDTIEGQNELEVEISDDGTGFKLEDVETGHYGLLGMRERVRLAGGRLEIRSEAGKGTQLMIRFPLEKPANE